MKIFRGDCMPFLESLDDQSADFAFYDPPYNIGKDYGTYKDDLPQDEYKAWMEKVASEVRRLSRRGFAVYVGSKLTRLFLGILPDAHLIPVHKRAVGSMNGNYFLQYHALFVVGKPIIPCKDLWDDVRLPGEGYYFREERFDDHPGQTALALVKKTLHHFTKPGDVVLDPFIGIGTTAVAALEMGRDIIGCELHQRYFDTTKRRIKALKAQPFLLAPGPSPKQLELA